MDCYTRLLNSANVMAVAMDTFKDSDDTISLGKLGIKSRSVISGMISEEIPLPSFPITRIPQSPNSF